jgi:hypothetical protein
MRAGRTGIGVKRPGANGNRGKTTRGGGQTGFGAKRPGTGRRKGLGL